MQSIRGQYSGTGQLQMVRCFGLHAHDRWCFLDGHRCLLLPKSENLVDHDDVHPLFRDVDVVHFHSCQLSHLVAIQEPYNQRAYKCCQICVHEG